MVASRKFSREFKLEAIELVTKRGVSATQAGKALGGHESLLRKWVRELSETPREASPGNGKQKAQDAETARLRKEVAKLKMERDILKKMAVACLADESMGRSASWRNTAGLVRPI